MTFLYDDNVFVKLLSEAGVIQDLLKKAQQAEASAKDIALKLANNLLTQNISIDGKDADIFVKDLVSLDAYLNYLMKNERRTNDGMSIVLQGQGMNGSTPPEANKQFYKPYSGFWVHTTGLASLITQLDMEAQKPGNQVMKPLVKNLKAEATKAFGTDFSHQEGPPNPYDANEDPNKADYKGSMYFKSPKEQADKTTSTKNPVTLSAAITNSPPFDSTDAISPLDMRNFIVNMRNLVGSGTLNNSEFLITQFSQLQTNMMKDYEDWIRFVGRVSSVSPDAESSRDVVRYNPAKPWTTFKQIFKGGEPDPSGQVVGNANEAMNRLIDMVSLILTAFSIIKRSPQLTGLLGKEFVSSQVNRGETILRGLQQYAK